MISVRDYPSLYVFRHELTSKGFPTLTMVQPEGDPVEHLIGIR
jgi:hypothetical protein